MKAWCTYHRQRGLSLVELMIAMLLGLILVGGVIEVFLSSRASYRLSSALSEVQENGRFAMNFIVHDARQAGYSGCNADINPVNALDTDSPDYDPSVLSFQYGVNGYDGSGTAAATTSWSPNLTAPLYTNLTNKPIPGTDVLSIRTIQDQGIVLEDGMPSTSANMKVNDNSGLAIGDILLISDCSSAAVFQVTKLPSGNKVNHNTGNDAAPGNATKKVVNAFQQGAGISKISTVTYFIAARGNATSCDSGECGLWRTRTVNKNGTAIQQEEELVDGVTNMQILYGVDTTGDGIVDQYVPASGTINWNNVYSIKIALLAESSDVAVSKPATTPSYTLLNQTVTPPNDLHLRQVFTTTVSLRNKQLHT